MRTARYGYEHQAARNGYAMTVSEGFAICARCGERIEPGSPWHLDHRDGGAGYLGPSHARCNLSAAGRRSGAVRRRRARVQSWSRDW